jgi:hypothetical protein
MSKVIDLEAARRRRMLEQARGAYGYWWNLWFRPPAMPSGGLEQLSPEELRWGGEWGPVVDRGRQSGADLRLL